MLKFIIGVFMFLCLASSAFADCSRPTAPEIPDPSSAVTAQMVKAQNEVKTYISDAEKYLSCENRSRVREEIAAEMESIADRFNKSIRAYKERMENA